MNSYLLRRLAPFFVFSVLVEFGFMALQLYQNAANVDFSFLTMVKTGGVLLLTTSVSFLFVMQPYVFYLLILPRRRQNSRLDKIITTTAFFIFAFSTLCEEAASQIFWEEFASSFNFIVVDYIIFTHQVLSNLEHAYPVIKILLGILAAASSSRCWPTAGCLLPLKRRNSTGVCFKASSTVWSAFWPI